MIPPKNPSFFASSSTVQRCRQICKRRARFTTLASSHLLIFPCQLEEVVAIPFLEIAATSGRRRRAEIGTLEVGNSAVG